jgi:hypothetical protein
VIVEKNELVYSLVKNPDSIWEIEYKNDKIRAEDDTVEAFLLLSCYLPYRDQFPLKSGAESPQIKDFGLDPPTITLTTFARETVTQFLGNQTPTGTEYYYTNSDDKEKISTIPSLFYARLNFKPFDFKSRALFYDLDDNVEKITVSFSQFQLELIKKGGSWQEFSQKITQKEAGDLVNLLRSFRFKQYFGPMTKQQLSYYSIDYPDVVIEINRVGRDVSESYALSSVSQRYYLSVTMADETYLPILDGKPPRVFFETLVNMARQLPSS